MADSPDLVVHTTSSLEPSHNVAPDPDLGGSESEWEYEYDDNETETFYVTVELTPGLSAPNTKLPRKPRDSHGIHDADDQSADDGDAPPEEDDLNGVEERHEFEEDMPHRVQILDLHSLDPLISFQNRIHHCEWASSVSSSLFFTAHDPSNPSIPVVRSTPHFDLIGISSSRMTSSATHLAPRNPGRPTRDDLFITEGPPRQQPQDNITLTPTTVGTLMPIQLNPSVDASRKAQASFLERLSAIKRTAGEQDEVTVIAKKVLHGTGWRYQRRSKLQMLEDRVEEGDELAERVLADMYMPSRRPEVVGRPEIGLGSRGGRVKTRYARGRPGRPRTSGMTALFNHTVAGASREEGSAEPLGYTPESWDEIEARLCPRKPPHPPGGSHPFGASHHPEAPHPPQDVPWPVTRYQGESVGNKEISSP
ncbi:hypothetical protein FGG08_006075 [Glutinoglossum americanum]|uniref:Transcription factor TFIIIC triple barrel domain-containing protein n=1 Tax=Glutinoglossum americanum TaxID=1670608 RepID=A0A9P8KVD3_9PEZI|nr:hypothetical protein FGG08_006075 [Glutinoglossum americanum]